MVTFCVHLAGNASADVILLHLVNAKEPHLGAYELFGFDHSLMTLMGKSDGPSSEGSW